METIDRDLQQRVWERVRSVAPAGNDPARLLELIAGEWTDAAAYLQLSRHYRGADAALLRQMHREEMAHCACLKGIYTLYTGQKAAVKAPPLPKELPEAALRRCYHRERQSQETYRQWMEHPEFGPVFARMHEQELQHCRSLLELIGRFAAK